MKIPYSDFVNKLKKLYGSFDEEHKKFEKAPNSEISRELGYSDAQFSRLINEHATEGEYQRANQNADRILILIDYEEKFAKIGIDPKSALASPRKRFLFFLSGLILGGASIYFFTLDSSDQAGQLSRYDMLKWTFESNFINPYKGLRDLPADCDYQCYKYQGKWELKNEYKLPFLRESSGFHYLAKSVVAYIRCVPNENPNGKLMIGYEYQEHEIWYDIMERPIDSFISEDGTPLESYENLKFHEQDDYVKIGTVHSFYSNNFSLDSTLIHRKGQDIGRDIEFVTDDELEEKINNKTLLKKIKREMTLIVQDPLHDFSKPSSCEPAEKPSIDFHEISNGDEMAFNCQMTTAGRFSINYSKTYVLKDQFVKDNCRSGEGTD
jgi:hypothetical protein